MKKCPKCGIELALYRFVKEVIDNDRERHTRIYVCRNMNCDSFEKEVYQTIKTVEIEN